MKSITLFVCLLMAAHFSFAQDSTASINSSWESYASDPTLTYQQIVTTCDSLFSLAGYPDTAAADTAWSEHDGAPYTDYLRWKNFWATRCDNTTGKLHSFVADALALSGGGSSFSPSSSSSSTNCGSTSLLQSTINTTPATAVGWQFIGPQSITNSGSGGYGNGLSQHIGQVDGIIVNPNSFSVVPTASGSSMPSEIYTTDAWGGLWKTTNAQLAPNNTWTCLSDHLPWLSGIGLTKLYVDFTATPHHLFCIAGEPIAYCFPLTTDYLPHTVGIYYSFDDGATFIPLPMPAFTPPIGENPIFDMKFWPGNATSTEQYLFVCTQYQIYRVDITNLTNDPTTTTATWTPIIDESTVIPPYTFSPEQESRFRGFVEMGFTQASPDVMYVSTNTNNNGMPYPAVGGLYRSSSVSTCTTCTLTGLPVYSTTDILNGEGSFTSDPIYGAGPWYVSTYTITPTGTPSVTPSWKWSLIDQNLQCTPRLPQISSVTCPTCAVSSTEVPVPGSYFDQLTYNVTFTLYLPPYTEVDVVLKDVAPQNIGAADWGYSVTPTPSDAYTANFAVGPGFNYTGTGTVTPTAGQYINNSTTTQSVTVTAASVPTTHYVDRLEFGAYIIPGSAGTTSGNVTLSSVVIDQPYQNYISNFASSPVSYNYLYCYTAFPSNAIQKIYDDGTVYSVTSTPNTMPTYIYPDGSRSTANEFTISAHNPDIIYEYSSQTGEGLWLGQLDLGTGITTNDGTISGSYLHVDGRSLAAIPNAAGTDDILYYGEDGGIGVGSYSGPWQSLNGTGMKTSWAFDIGSSIHTGEVGIAATDNGVLWSNNNDFTHWYCNIIGDGGQFKYGKRYTTRNVKFQGSSGGTGYIYLTYDFPYPGGIPNVRLIHPDPQTVNVPPLGKLVTTYNNEYFGSGSPTDASGPPNTVFSMSVAGAGTAVSAYTITPRALTTGVYTVTNTTGTVGTYTINASPVQAVAPDPYDPNFIAVYMHVAFWDQGYFAYCYNATAAVPTWTVYSNNPSLNPAGNTNWNSIICVATDPRPYASSKRLWAGASGYFVDPSTGVSVAGTDRVFQITNGGSTLSDLSAGLPAGPVNVLAYDDQSHYLFAGTDQGVYALNVDDGSNTWQCFSLNLPNSYVTGLDINRCTGKIYVSLYGRGAYEANLPPDANVNGTSTTDGALGITDGSDLDIISGATTWTQDKDEVRSIYIPPGATLTIQNCTVNMGYNKSIIVAAGGTLLVNGATLTNSCGSMWQGIIVEGSTSLPQNTTNDGSVTIDWASTIQNALVAVSNYNPGGTAGVGTGGIIQAANSTFYNNGQDAVILPYTNHSGSTVIASTCLFNNCKFLNDNNALYTGPAFITANGVNGMRVFSSVFTNSTTATVNGINANDVGLHISGGNFNNFQAAVNAAYPSATNSLLVDFATFNNNNIGIEVNGGNAEVMIYDTFNIPAYSGLGGGPYGSSDVYAVNDQHVGVLLTGTFGYTCQQNLFRTNAAPSAGFGYYPFTTGTIEWNDGGDLNQVVGNTFKGVGVAMSSNYDNSAGAMAGLQYLCDTDHHIGFDIAICGINGLGTGGSDGPGGIGYEFSYNSVSHSVASAGNLFSVQWNVFNHQQPIDYWWDLPIEDPLNIYGLVTPINITKTATCNYIPFIIANSGAAGTSVLSPEQQQDPRMLHALATANVNYYMTDTIGITHRDSLYYWAGQMKSAYGQLLITNLLIQDSLIDSANTVYDSILSHYTLDSSEINDFTLGRNLIDILMSQRINGQSLLVLDSNQVDSLQYIAANATMWAHCRAESWLFMYNGTPFNDTLLYPGIKPPPPPPCPGVLTVTEISNGPTPAQAAPGQSVPVSGCNYAEILVSGCGTCSSPGVNVQGWILDDNDGSFDLNGCTATAGVTESHYRLSYDSIWANVPVGSMIVVYNADSNCYNLPDTFTVTPGNGINGDKASFGNTYWVPLGGTEANPLGNPHMQRFQFILDSSLCNYIVDTITIADTTYDSSYYALASDWQNTINFDPNGDAFQVRCPRCGHDMTQQPDFYHGFGYGPDSGSNQFNNIPPNANSPGGAVTGNTGQGHKYCFMGSGASNLGDSSQWNTYSADAPGTPPPTLGNVNTPYGTGAQQGTLGLPCCERTHHHSDDRNNKTGGGSNNKNSNGSTNPILFLGGGRGWLQSLSVYPIPATMTLNFSYSLQDNITIKLFDVTGRIMDTQMLQNSSSTSFNVEGYIPGIYMYQVITNTNTQSGKVLIGK